MSTHSTGASGSTLASIRSASRCSSRRGPTARARPSRERSVAAATARSASRCPPRAISRERLLVDRRDVGEGVALATRSPPMKWSGET